MKLTDKDCCLSSAHTTFQLFCGPPPPKSAVASATNAGVNLIVPHQTIPRPSLSPPWLDGPKCCQLPGNLGNFCPPIPHPPTLLCALFWTCSLLPF